MKHTNKFIKMNCIFPAAGFLFLSLLVTSCATNMLTMSVTEPAPVTVPASINKVVVINRSMPSKKTKNLDKFEKILSAEGKNLDKDGAQEAVQALYDELGMHDRFTEVKLADPVQTDNPGFGVFPASMSWEKVNKICREHNVDALFVLSFYDTDAKIDYKAVPVEVNTALGIDVPAVEHQATVVTKIKTGWRIYDPANKIILDEFIVHEQVVSSGRGINPMKAIQAVMGRRQQVLEVSKIIGQNYASRIFPYRIRVSREYYVRGTNNFKIAKRRARTGDWDGAAELWEREVDNPKRKAAGRACYNMAIINEINGNLEAAVDWASKAYTDYRIKKALDYLNILKYRIARNEQLRQQTGE